MYIFIHANYLIIWKDYWTEIVKQYKTNVNKSCRALFERKYLSDDIIIELIHANYLAEYKKKNNRQK